MKKDVVRQWIIILTFIVMIAANVLAEALPINGQTTAAISDSFKVVFVPAGYVFSIWGIIYLALLGFTIYQALPSKRTNPYLRKIGYLFAATNLLNAGWIVLWHFNLYLLTMLVMIALLVTLILIYLRLDIGKVKVSAAEKLLVHVPFSIYLGWITVATIANATALLKYLGWNGFGISGEIWTVILLGVGVVLAGILSWTLSRYCLCTRTRLGFCWYCSQMAGSVSTRHHFRIYCSRHRILKYGVNLFET